MKRIMQALLKIIVVKDVMIWQAKQATIIVEAQKNNIKPLNNYAYIHNSRVHLA